MTSNGDSPRNGSWAIWLIAAGAVTAGMTLLATHAPPRLKLLGLFPLGVGLIHGALLGRLSEQFPGVPRAVRLGVGASLTLAMLISQSLLTWQRQVQQLQQIDQAAIDVPPAVGQTDADPLTRTSALDVARQMRRQYLADQGHFRAYLEKRLRSLGSPFEKYDPERFGWGQCVWGLELMLGTAAAAWMLQAIGRENAASSDDLSSGN